MKIISSTIRPKIRKVFSVLMILIALTGAFILLFLLLFKDVKFEKLAQAIPFLLFFLFMGSLAYFNKREVVYIDKNDFVVRGKKILITDVISIRRNFRSLDFKVRYYDETDKIKSFTLEIDWLGLSLPDFMKQLIALAEKNNHDTRLP